MARITYAVVRRILVDLENMLLSMQICTVVSAEAFKASAEVVSVSFICPIRSLSSEVSILASFYCSYGQLHSCSHIKFGPLNHLDLLLNYDWGIPRVRSAAGFRGPGQCFHRLAWVLSKISATL